MNARWVLYNLSYLSVEGGERMVHKTKSDYISWIAIFSVVILLIEIAFFNGGLLFSAFMSILFLYFGKKNSHRFIGKISLLIGSINAIISVTNMVTFKLILLALLVYLVYIFLESKKNPKVFSEPILKEQHPHPAETIVSIPYLFRQISFGSQKTSTVAYEWNDINIQHGVGDFIVDFSNTVLPKGESIVSIRNVIGSIQILVPYDIEVCIHHSVLIGKATILQNEEQRLLNQTIHYHTSLYDEGDYKIKIVTSTAVGDIEVKRI